MNALLQTLRNLGPIRLAAMGGVTIALIGFFAYLMARLSTPEMGLLYGDLDLTDSGAMVQKLEELAVPYEVSANGAAISVPVDRVEQVRVLLAQDGLPKRGSIGTVGNEIWDQASGFGTTNFIQNINKVRALEGELARTIGTIENVQAARVHLVLPERELFSRDRQEPSASVFLQLNRSGLSGSQITAIQHLIAAAVPRLQPKNISVVDDQGNLLASPADEGELRLLSTEEMRQKYERKLAETIEQLLSRSVGFGKVRAQVTVDMDFDRVTVSEERYDPDSQVARSTQVIEERQENNEGAGPDPVSVATNLPEADVPSLFGPGAGGATNSSSRLEETTNYEISKVVQNTVRETGRVNRLSAAVLIDGTYQTGPDGTVQYQPRSAEEMAQLTALVRSAIGFDERRGDMLEVVNLRFVSDDQQSVAETPELLFGMAREDWFRLMEMAVLAVVAALVILLVVRPLLGRLLEGGSAPAPVVDAFEGLLPEASMPRPALAGPGMAALAGPDLSIPVARPRQETSADEIDALIDINQVEGRVRASSLKKVGEIVDKHPEEAVSIIRNWMYQET